MTIQIAVRLPDAMVDQLDQLVSQTGRTRSESVRRAIELYLYRAACERDAKRYDELPLSESELAFGDDVDSWSATPAW